MDRTLIGSLLRPKHLVATFAVFLALGGLAGFVVGAASAANEDPLAGNEFTFATPQVGDRGHYEFSGGAAPGLGGDATGMDFEVLPDLQGVDAQGRSRLMNRLSIVEVPNDDPFFTAQVHRMDATTGELVAIERGLQESQTEDGKMRGRDYVAVDFPINGPGWDAPCGLRHELQGTTWDLAPRPVQRVCQGGPHEHVSGWTWVATGVADVDGVQHLRAELRLEDRARVVYEFREDVAYPLSILYLRGDDMAATLTALEAGTRGPVALSGPGPGLPAPALDLRPRTPWLVDDGDLEHPFPLSEAWRLAKEDAIEPAFRDFLQERPGAFLTRAWMRDDREGGERSLGWRFEVSDGAKTIDVRIGEPTPQVADDPGNSNDPVQSVRDLVFGAAPPTEEEPEAGYEFDITDASDDVPLLAAIPATLPSVASMVAQWRLHVGPEHAGDDGLYLHVSAMCGETCADVDLRLYVGSAVYTRNGDTDTYSSSTLEWWMFPARFPDSVHHPSRYQEDVSTWAPAAPPSESAPPAAPRHLFASAVPFWQMPGGKATAGVGASALLAALAYWLWPVAKGGGLGLFSRVHKDRLLDNPLRQQLVQRIEAEPGVHHNALVRELGKGKGAAEHHLEKLVASRLVLRHRSPGYTCYFPVGTDHRNMAAGPALKADGARRILEALRNGASGVRAIAVITDLAPSTVSHHLERLRAAGLVVGDGRTGFQAVAGRSDAGLAAA